MIWMILMKLGIYLVTVLALSYLVGRILEGTTDGKDGVPVMLLDKQRPGTSYMGVLPAPVRETCTFDDKIVYICEDDSAWMIFEGELTEIKFDGK